MWLGLGENRDRKALHYLVTSRRNYVMLSLICVKCSCGQIRLRMVSCRSSSRAFRSRAGLTRQQIHSQIHACDLRLTPHFIATRSHLQGRVIMQSSLNYPMREEELMCTILNSPDSSRASNRDPRPPH